jgi:hypothetical protein
MIRSFATKTFFALYLLMLSANIIQAQSFAKPNGVQVETIIQADAAEVWAILLRFEDYPNWNPYITKIEGEAERGK